MCDMRFSLSGVVFFSYLCSAAIFAEDSVEFNRDIRPILSDRCFLCHGPDQSSEQAKETDLRLDDRDSSVEHGVFNFDNVDESGLIARVTSDDPDLQMPPPDSHKKPLSAAELKTIKAWIQQGAQFQKHWAYIPPVRPDTPAVKSQERVANPVDAFVIKQLEENGISPSPTADRNTLIRRITYDLTGLPPTIQDLKQFINDPEPLDVAYEKVVDRLLNSPKYGEHMARYWLDAARYADTSGYQYDRERKQWVWRDWVIHAFNSNMPFDQFTMEQLAGDLIPEATDQTRLATGFNRNHPITIEGGVVDEEYRTEYVIDRVVTTSTVWMGQTFLCARCHDHKYDPISQKNFYEFYSFFNNVPERGLNGFDPKLTVSSPLNTRVQELGQELAQVTKRITAMNLPFTEWEQQLRMTNAKWNAVVPKSVKSSGGATPKQLEDLSTLLTEVNPAKDDYEILLDVDQVVQSIQLEALVDPSLTNGSASRGSNGNFVLSEFVVEAKVPSATEFKQVKILNAQADYEQKNFTINLAHDGRVDASGWAVDGNSKPENRMATFQLAEPIPAGAELRVTMQHRYGLSHQIGRFRLSFSETSPLSTELQQLIAVAEDKRTTEQEETLKLLLVEKYGDNKAGQQLKELQALRTELKQEATVPATMVMKEMITPRQAFVLERGEYDKAIKEQPVSPNVPAAIGAMPAEFPQNRLGLAQWLVSPEQPLTARVTVNRFWQRLFGTGLVKTSEDFGSQGAYPSHPELLDWLSVEFMENGWNIKQLLKTIVMSNTYKQSSHLSEKAYASDPENRMLARGPRTRLAGEEIRDSALAISGLLNERIGGPSVYPYHPKGLWLEINNRPNYSRAYPHQTDAAQQYRRTLYTFWKRTVPPPSMSTFDAPGREYCVVRRSSTNTPLQAFVMLHDPQFVEAARHLATRMIKEGGKTTASRITFGFRCCTSRTPTDQELAVLLSTYAGQFKKFDANPKLTDQLLSVGVSPTDLSIDRTELATFTHIARMLMNLSEFLTKG